MYKKASKKLSLLWSIKGDDFGEKSEIEMFRSVKGIRESNKKQLISWIRLGYFRLNPLTYGWFYRTITLIGNGIKRFLYIHIAYPQIFLTKCSLKRTQKLTFLKNFRTKIFIFEYFPKLPSERNSKHPFYLFFIRITSHARRFLLVGGASQGAD